MRNHEMQTAPDSPAKKSSRAADPATTKAQDHQNSTANSTAVDASTGGGTVTNISVAASTVRARATDLLLSGDPVARELFQWGHRVGAQDTVDRFHDRGAHIANEFLDYLAEEPQATPGPIPPLENTRRHLGVAA